MDYKKVSKLITEYNSLYQSPQDEGYQRKLCLESTLRNIVLTASELVEKGVLEQIIEPILESNLKETRYKLEKDEKLIEGYKKKIFNLSKKHRKLKGEHEELTEMYEESPEDYQELVKQIESIISGKQGTLIKEIRSVLQE